MNLVVTYSDTAAINAGSIGAGNLTVTGPGGLSLAVGQVVASSTVNATAITVIYTVDAPAGGFVNADNGVFTVSIVAGQVSDVNGAATGALSLGSFTVDIPAVVGPSASQTVLTFPAASLNVSSGNLADWTATVEPAAGLVGPVPTGSITFYDGSTALGTVALDGGQASFSTAALAGGNHSITGVYSGDTNYNVSTSTVTSVVVTTPLATAPVLKPTLPLAVFPKTLVIGAKTKFAVPLFIGNTGPTTESGIVHVVLYASTDSVLDQNAKVIGTPLRLKVNIKAGRALKTAFHVTGFPSTMAAGSYYLLAQVVDASGFAQTATSVATINLGLPVITPSAKFVSGPVTAVSGKKKGGNFTVAITNGGNVAMAGTAVVTGYLTANGTVDANSSLVRVLNVKLAIAAGKSKKFAFPISPVPAGLDGLYQLVLVFQVPAANGAAATTFTVVDPTTVDLLV